MSERPVASASQTVGPFFHVGLARETIAQLVPPVAGARVQLHITVTDGDDAPVRDALIEVWQTGNASGCAFGRMATDAEGTCEFAVARTPHINLCLFARGLLRHIHTRIYFAGDPALERDPVLALVPPDRRETLLATEDETQPARWRFHLRLQGPLETVFFDP